MRFELNQWFNFELRWFGSGLVIDQKESLFCIPRDQFPSLFLQFSFRKKCKIFFLRRLKVGVGIRATLGTPNNFLWHAETPSFTYQFCFDSQEVLFNNGQ